VKVLVKAMKEFFANTGFSLLELKVDIKHWQAKQRDLARWRLFHIDNYAEIITGKRYAPTVTTDFAAVEIGALSSKWALQHFAKLIGSVAHFVFYNRGAGVGIGVHVLEITIYPPATGGQMETTSFSINSHSARLSGLMKCPFTNTMCAIFSGM
jgi:hypothetical protein